MVDCGGSGVDEDGAELLLPSDRKQPWRLNFEGFRPPAPPEEKLPRSLRDCLGILGGGDVVAEYYQQQVEMLEGFIEMDTLADRGFLPGMSKEECERIARSEKMAIRISNVANMVLFAAKVYASVRSRSLAIIASTLDSLLDLLSGFILWFASFSMQTPNPYQYPIGKRRMQPLLQNGVCIVIFVFRHRLKLILAFTEQPCLRNEQTIDLLLGNSTIRKSLLTFPT